MKQRWVAVVLLLLGAPAAGRAQAGIPGSRLESARDNRAAVRAEAYSGVAKFFAEWREAWNGREAQALMRLYTDDAAVRFPGQAIVRGQEPLQVAVGSAFASAASISMSDIDFDSDGERSIVVSRYVVRRDGRLLEGIMTAVLHRFRSSWRLRVQVFDAPESSASAGWVPRDTVRAPRED